MCDKIDFVVCRLCLNSGGVLINIFDKNNKSEFMLENTIEDLINVKVVEDANYPWLICSNCIEKVTEFRLFKNRCAECLFVYYNRIQKGSNPVTDGWLTNRQEEVSDVLTQDNNNPREHMVDGTSDKVWASSSTVESAVHSVGTASVEMKNPYSPVHGMHFMAINDCNEVNIQFPGEIKKEIEDETIARDAADGSEVDVQDDMIIVKEEIDITSGCSVPLKIDTGSSMQEGYSHWLDNEDSSHLDNLEDAEISMPSEEEVNIKEDFDTEIPQMEVRLEWEVLQEEDKHQKQVNAGDDASASQSYMCETCYKVFEQKDLLKDHVMHKHLKKMMQFRCDVCLEAFKRKIDLASHIKLVHALKKKHQCEFCSKNFPYLSKLKIHMLTHTRKRPFQCALCLKGFAGKIHLKKHMLTHTDRREHICEICSKVFTCIGTLKRHVLTHTGDRPYKCRICHNTFTRNFTLKTHMLTHTGDKPHKCQLCLKAFTVKSHLKSHILTHTGEKPYKCRICQKTFTHSSSLKTHMLTHTGEKPYKCRICQKTFTQKCHLKTHMLIHTGERPYKCRICHNTFTKNCILKTHMLTHTGDKPYKCHLCLKTFTVKSHLKSHILTHSGEKPCKCRICERTFTQSSGLKTHMLMHTGERPYKCRICQKTFTQKCHLKTHMLTHTGEKPNM